MNPMTTKGQHKDTQALRTQGVTGRSDDFVLEKTIFSNVFDKDVKRVYIYKKAERLAKAVHLIAPAFKQSHFHVDRLNRISVSIVDAALLPPAEAKDALARDLLSLSSLLSIARTSGLLSPMNADLVSREAQLLLEEVASYEEPRMALEESSTLAELARAATTRGAHERHVSPARPAEEEAAGTTRPLGHSKGQIKDTPPTEKKTGRRDAIIASLRGKGPSYIKDISTLIREVSEKTIQRELQTLVEEGIVTRSGERRWTTYELAVS